MVRERRSAHRYAFVASAEVIDSCGQRSARVEDLSIAGAYLAMAHPFSKRSTVLIKIRTATEFFQCYATVAHATHGVGMGVQFRDISPPFLHILQSWLLAAIHDES